MGRRSAPGGRDTQRLSRRGCPAAAAPARAATTSPQYSLGLREDVRAAGGRYVEAPVSGSRGPAEAGRLVALLGGDPDDLAVVGPLLAPVAAATFLCGEVPAATAMKLAVNLHLITLVTGLAEAAHLAREHGLDLAVFAEVLAAGPMSSEVPRAKAAALVREDFTVQASIANVLDNNRLVAQAARSVGASSPVLDACHALYAEADAAGHGGQDMAAVVRALEARTRAARADGR